MAKRKRRRTRARRGPPKRHRFRRGHRPWNKGKKLRHYGAIRAHRRRVNPRHLRRRRRRNPGIVGAFFGRAKDALKAAPAAIGGGFLVNVIHGKVVGSRGMVVDTLAKVGIGVAGSLAVGRFLSANAGTAFLHGSLGAIGGDLGARAGGGIVATSKVAATKGIADAVAEDSEMAELLVQELRGVGGLGALLTGVGDDDDIGAYGDETPEYGDMLLEGF